MTKNNESSVIEEPVTELVVVDMSEYGMDADKAQAVKKDFDVVLSKAVELESGLKEVLALPITPETCAKAKTLRLRCVKIRTGITAVHKERKAFYLSGGRAVDGLKNAYIHAVSGIEDKLKEIETHYERIEEERLKALQAERVERLSPFVEDARERDLTKFEADEFEALFQMKKKQHEDLIEAQRQAEADRVAKEKAEADERERIRKENEKLKAEQAKVEAERKAEREEAERKLKAEREERERMESEALAKAKAEALEKAKVAKLEANKAHQKRVNNKALQALMSMVDGLTEAQGKQIIINIAKGNVPNVSINYGSAE